MGEMVKTCPKVNYKLNYKPGEVLDMTTFKWLKVEEVSG
jgi:arginyl-tRNA--protein-N-Asp/Glu arginylyltransferase